MRTVLRLICAVLITALSSFTALPVAADTVNLLSIRSGHSTIVDAPGLTRVAVGDGRIAGVVPIGTQQVVINGKIAGHTTVFVWSGGRRVDYEVTVTEQGIDDVVQLMRTAIDEPNVQVINMGQSIVLRGSVDNGSRFARLEEVLHRFNGIKVNGSNGKKSDDKFPFVNAVTIAHPFGTTQGDLAKLGSNIRLDEDAKGNVVVSGRVKDRTTAENVLARARGMAGPYLSTDGKVIDRLAVDATSQVNVKVYVLEVDRTALNQLGVRLQGAIPDDVIHPQHYTLGNPSFPATEVGATGAGSLGPGAFFRTTLLAPTLDLLAQEGHARVLSSPNLVTMPGNQATFLVGGEVPYAYSTGLGNTSIVFKEYGVKLQITPSILGSGGIDTKIAPEVSELDYASGIQLNGFSIPALKTSRLSTDVVTQPGESIVMGGLMRRLDQRTVNKVPFLGDLPILGRLFRSVNYQRGDTDVVFVMTPEIINR